MTLSKLTWRSREEPRSGDVLEGNRLLHPGKVGVNIKTLLLDGDDDGDGCDGDGKDDLLGRQDAKWHWRSGKPKAQPWSPLGPGILHKCTWGFAICHANQAKNNLVRANRYKTKKNN